MKGAKILSTKVVAEVSMPSENVQGFVDEFQKTHEVEVRTDCKEIVGNKVIRVIMNEGVADFFPAEFDDFCREREIESGEIVFKC